MKLLFDQDSLDYVELTAQSQSREDSQIAEVIDEKLSLREIVFLGQLMQKCGGWVGATSFKHSDIENELCFYVYCSVHPKPVAVNLDSDFTNDDPRRLRCRRVWNAIRQPTYLVSDGLMRVLYDE